MSKVLINMNTLKVADYDSATRPFHFEVNIPSLQFTKEVTKFIEKHKTNFLGEKLYNITINGKNYEVTENQLMDNIGAPVTDKIPVTKTIKFLENPLEFNLDDIIENKKKQLTTNNCKLFEVNLQDYIDFNYVNHKADTGYKIIRIHPNGSIKLKVINFDFDINNANVIIENTNDINIKYSFDGIEYSDGNTIYSEKTFNKLYLIFENTSDKPIDINCFYITF